MSNCSVSLQRNPNRFQGKCPVSLKSRPNVRKLRIARLQWLALLTVVLGLGIGSAWAQGDTVLTYHFDNVRSGQITTETTLVSSKVNPTRFGKLFFYPVDGQVAAQPLYVPNVTLPGLGKHNVVYVVTQHDSVYALDADNPATGTLWHVSFLNSAAGVTSVPISEQGCADTGFTEMGILGTPVIDPTTGTLYVAVKTREQSGSQIHYVHRLHAIDITTGSEKLGVQYIGPVPKASPPSLEWDSFHRVRIERMRSEVSRVGDGLQPDHSPATRRLQYLAQLHVGLFSLDERWRNCRRQRGFYLRRNRQRAF